MAAAMILAAGCNADRERAPGGPPQPTLPFAEPASAAASKPAASDLLLQAIGAHRVVLLGEMHGTEEAPALAGQLVSHYAAARAPVLLGLEIDRNEQADADRFLESDGDAQARRALLAGTHWLAPFDGRDSEPMFELIDRVRQLRASGADVRIVYFDDPDTDMDRRNRRMADGLHAVVASSPRAMLLVLTGNVHAMTRRPPGDLYSEEGRRIDPPMTVVRYLWELHPVSIDIEAASGDFCACMGGRCERQELQPRPPIANSTLHQEDAMESAWDFTLTLPRFHASMPAVQHLASPQSGGHTAATH